MTETREERARRRRWLSLAELVAVASVLIGAAGLYFNWSDRHETQAERAAASAKESKAARIVLLEASGSGDTLTLSDANHKVDTIDVAFPPALGVAAPDAAEPRVEADWFRDALLKATDGGADDQKGRLPVLITAHWWDADVKRSDRAVYDLAWRTHGRFGRGRALELTGMSLRERGGSAKRLDALWQRPAG